MRVKNMTSAKTGRSVPNQFVIEHDDGKTRTRYFQSYQTIIVKDVLEYAEGQMWKTYLDKYKWNCSRTTSKYRNQFLDETTKETKKKIKSGEYILADLN